MSNEKPYQNKDYLEYQLTVLNKTPKEIAEDHDISITTARRHLFKNGLITINGNRNVESDKAVRRDYLRIFIKKYCKIAPNRFMKRKDLLEAVNSFLKKKKYKKTSTTFLTRDLKSLELGIDISKYNNKRKSNEKYYGIRFNLKGLKKFNRLEYFKQIARLKLRSKAKHLSPKDLKFLSSYYPAFQYLRYVVNLYNGNKNFRRSHGLNRISLRKSLYTLIKIEQLSIEKNLSLITQIKIATILYIISDLSKEIISNHIIDVSIFSIDKILKLINSQTEELKNRILRFEQATKKHDFF